MDLLAAQEAELQRWEEEEEAEQKQQEEEEARRWEEERTIVAAQKFFFFMSLMVPMNINASAYFHKCICYFAATQSL